MRIRKELLAAGGILVGIPIGRRVLRYLKGCVERYHYGKTAAERFREDHFAAQVFNKDWTQRILKAHQAGESLIEIGGYRICGPSHVYSKSFMKACRLYDQAIGRL
jgi:hypothetical protein